MSIRKTALVAALGLSMASAPVMAQTSAPTSVVERTSADMDQANEIRHGGSFIFITIFVVIAIGLGIYFATHKNDDRPTSP